MSIDAPLAIAMAGAATASPAPVRVYLDSSDYSRLSDPRRRSAETEEQRRQLLEWAKAGAVQFAFSSVHLSEMAPLDADYARAATARADLLVALCGRNALISFDRLLALELRATDSRLVRDEDVLSSDGDWFPSLDDIASPVQWADAIAGVDETGKGLGMNRAQRRAAKHKLFKRGGPSSGSRRFLTENVNSFDFREIMKKYPMRLRDAKVIARYVIGDATKEEANSAFLESLRDPRWMMRWFAENYTKMTPITTWFRGASEKLHGAMQGQMASVADWREKAKTLPVVAPVTLFSVAQWRDFADDALVGIASNLRKTVGLGTRVISSADEVRRLSPGFSTCMGTLYSTMWDLLGETPRMPKKSDAIDAVHSMYAPYVDVFMADSYMAPHVRKHASCYGTTVVASTPALLDAIEQRLRTIADANPARSGMAETSHS